MSDYDDDSEEERKQRRKSRKSQAVDRDDRQERRKSKYRDDSPPPRERNRDDDDEDIERQERRKSKRASEYRKSNAPERDDRRKSKKPTRDDSPPRREPELDTVELEELERRERRKSNRKSQRRDPSPPPPSDPPISVEPIPRHEDEPLPPKETNKATGFKFRETSWHDFFPALFFVLFTAGMITISVVAIGNGNPNNLADYICNTGNCSIVDNANKDIFTVVLAQQFQLLGSDYPVILISAIAAMLLGLIWVLLMRLITKLMIYITFFVTIGIVAAGGIWMVLFANGCGFNEVSRIVNVCSANKVLSSSEVTTFLIFGWFFIVLAAIILFTVIYIRKKINFTADIFLEGGRGLTANKSIFLVAGILVLTFFGFQAYWISTVFYMYTVNTLAYNNVSQSVFLSSLADNMKYLIWYMFFGWYWWTSFFFSIFRSTVISSIAIWFYNQGGPIQIDATNASAFTSLLRGLTKSLGSMALESLINPPVLIMNYLVRKGNQAINSKKKAWKYIFGWLIAFGCCCGHVIKKVTKFQLVFTAMYGLSYWEGANQSFNLLTKNKTTIVLVDSVGDFVILCAQIFGTAGTTILTLWTLNSINRDFSTLTIIFVAITDFGVFHFFASILSASVDTIFICYLEELKLQQRDSRLKDNAPHSISPYLHSRIQTMTMNRDDLLY